MDYKPKSHGQKGLYYFISNYLGGRGETQFEDFYTHENRHNGFVQVLGNPKENWNIKLRTQIYNRDIYQYSSVQSSAAKTVVSYSNFS